MPVRTQANRAAAVATPAGEDVLLLTGLSGSEQLGRPFEYELEMTSEQSDVDFDKVVGGNVTVRYERQDGGTRYVNGYVSRLVQASADGRLAHYRATVVPWLWFLTRTADCRIFQNQTVPVIVKAVFEANGFTDVDEHLSGTYDPWEYCVQYRETDFNFVSRLLEHEGIYYYFQHEDGLHKLVLCDSPAAHEAEAGYDKVAYRAPSSDSTGGYVTDWAVSRQVEPQAYAVTDFDFVKPASSLLGRSRVPRQDAGPAGEVFDYPGEHGTASAGEERAKVRVQELQARYEVASAVTDAVGLAVGQTFELTDFPRDDQNKSYLITSAGLRITADSYDAGGRSGGGDGGSTYGCHFTAVDAQVPYRPARVTPKPVVQGPQTAIVVGPSGQEIYTDAHGRVKVQFFWDRYGKADENSSCWVRVAQAWAGKGWGGIFIPRVGQEVVVDFLEGNPDRPLITGRVYNGASKPPYPLPDRKTVSGVKTNSSPDGGGFNELRFEDKKGSEQIFVHAEKDQHVRTKNDVKEWVGRDRHLVVTNDQVEHVANDRHETIDRDYMVKLGRDHHVKIAGKEATAIDGTRSLKVTGNVAEQFGADHSEQTTGDYYLKADDIVIEGMSSITIKVGQNSISIGPDGIKIDSSGTFDTVSTGPTTIKSTAPLSVQSQATAEVKAPMTTVSGDGMLTLTGGMVMIN